MPRTIAIDPRVPASHGIIIRRNTLVEQQRAFTTVQEARAYARRIIKQTQLHAEGIKQEAIQQGFSDGWKDSLEALYQALLGTQALSKKVESDLKKAIHQTMASSLEQPTLELQLLEGWLATSPSKPASIRLVLPRRAQSMTPTVIRRFEETLNITPTVTIGDGDGVVIECGDQIFEFSPSRILEETDELAKNCLRRLEVKKSYSEWSKHIVQQWLTDLAKRHQAPSPPPPKEDEEDEVEEDDELDDDFDDDWDDDDEDDE